MASLVFAQELVHYILSMHTEVSVIERYDRQMRVKQIGAAGQAKISASTILIVGCGALGTYAAEQLVRAGVGTLYLVDPDTVSETNLQRQSLFTEAAPMNCLKSMQQRLNYARSITMSPLTSFRWNCAPNCWRKCSH